MEKMTITEALAEVKLLKKKLEKKQTTILANIWRYEHMKDAFESEGGSQTVLRREQQSIDDLYKRLEKIRSSIAQANLSTLITLGTQSRSIYEWLVWKREVAKEQFAQLNQITQAVKQKSDQEAQRPQVFKDDATQAVQLCKLVTNVDYAEYLKKVEVHQELQEKLDGQLSLKNATVVIEF